MRGRVGITCRQARPRGGETAHLALLAPCPSFGRVGLVGALAFHQHNRYPFLPWEARGERRGDGLRVPRGRYGLAAACGLLPPQGFVSSAPPMQAGAGNAAVCRAFIFLLFFLRGISPCFCLPLGSLPSCAPPPAGCAHRRRCTPEGRYLAWHTLHRRFAPSSDKSSREGNTR